MNLLTVLAIAGVGVAAYMRGKKDAVCEMEKEIIAAGEELSTELNTVATEHELATADITESTTGPDAESVGIILDPSVDPDGSTPGAWETGGDVVGGVGHIDEHGNRHQY